MTDTTTGSVAMEVDDSNESGVSGNVHIEKNGVSDEEVKSVKSTHETDNDAKDVEDDSLLNLDLDKTEGDDSILSEDKDNTDNASEVVSGTSKVDEAKQLNGAGGESSVIGDSKVSDGVADANNDEVEAMDVDAGCPPSTESSEKQPSTPKPNAVTEILAEMPPKDSPEVIIANLSPFVKDRSESNDALVAKNDKEEEVNSKADVADTAEENLDSKEKETEPKEKSKSGKKKKNKICAQCEKKKKLPLRIVFHGQVYQLCSEVCYKNFKEKKTVKAPVSQKILNENCGQCLTKIQNGLGFFPAVGEMKVLCSEECVRKYHEKNGKPRNCNHCKKMVESVYNRLSWETMTFCNEDCLGKYQALLGSHCTCCQQPVMQTSLGKYSVCFGSDIRQFCSGSCLEDFKKGLKVCSFCQTDLSAVGEGFLAPVGDKGQFKDFCTQQCMERYEVMNNLNKSIPECQECAHCKKQGSFKIQVKHNDKTYSLCCDICVAGFRCSNQITENICGTCFKFFTPTENESFAFTFENSPKHFCTKVCMSSFALSNRKIIQCGQCKVKKYNFDMIEKIDANNHANMYCSLNCLSIHRVHQASSQRIRCDHCGKNVLAQYHLTMSDGSVRNFCTYECVVNFQKECLLSAIQTSVNVRNAANTARTVKPVSTGASNPVIANVVSLAQTRPAASPQNRNILPQTLVSVRPQGPAVSVLSPKPQVSSPQVASTSTLSTSMAQTTISGSYNEVIVRPPTPRNQRNKSASVKPIMQTKGVYVRSQTCHKAVQTDETQMPAILPVPFPIYIPSPTQMYTRTIPVPMPFPVPIPIPVPIFIKDKSPSKANEADLLKVATKSAECMKIIEESNKKLSQRLGISTEVASSSQAPKESVNNIHQEPINNIPQEPPVITPTEPGPSVPQTSAECESITMPTLVEKDNSLDGNNSIPIIAPKIEPMDDDTPVEIKPPRKKKRSGEDMIMHEVKRNKMDEELEVNNLTLSGDDEIVIL